ncbi:hypothetical protein [Streptomyces agglomeratus]|nr:hypothetical protein [Streptomyces agglomeratus]
MVANNLTLSGRRALASTPGAASNAASNAFLAWDAYLTYDG